MGCETLRLSTNVCHRNATSPLSRAHFDLFINAINSSMESEQIAVPCSHRESQGAIPGPGSMFASKHAFDPTLLSTLGGKSSAPRSTSPQSESWHLYVQIMHLQVLHSFPNTKQLRSAGDRVPQAYERHLLSAARSAAMVPGPGSPSPRFARRWGGAFHTPGAHGHQRSATAARWGARPSSFNKCVSSKRDVSAFPRPFRPVYKRHQLINGE